MGAAGPIGAANTSVARRLETLPVVAGEFALCRPDPHSGIEAVVFAVLVRVPAPQRKIRGWKRGRSSSRSQEGSESPSQFVRYITNMTSLRVTDEWLSLVCQAAFIGQLLGIPKEGTLVRSVTRQNVGRLGWRPADSRVAPLGMARRPNLVFSLPVGMRKSRNGTRELRFIIVVEGV